MNTKEVFKSDVFTLVIWACLIATAGASFYGDFSHSNSTEDSSEGNELISLDKSSDLTESESG